MKKKKTKKARRLPITVWQRVSLFSLHLRPLFFAACSKANEIECALQKKNTEDNSSWLAFIEVNILRIGLFVLTEG